MRKVFFCSLVVLFFIFEVSFVAAAHFVVGRVNDARDGNFADGEVVTLWNPAVGLADNLTDVVGPAGNSGQSNFYMIDCELLSSPCDLGDVLSVKVFDDNSGEYFSSREVNVTVTGAGYDLANNLTLNSPPQIDSVVVDDSLVSVSDEIDLVAASSREINCTANITELDGDSIQNVQGRFFYSTYSFETADDNNYHYSNDNCHVDYAFGGANESQVVCSFYLEYYSDPGSWNCQLRLEDNYSASSNETDSTNVNELLAIGISDLLNFGFGELQNVSSEKVANVTNYGNVMVNLSLSGYGAVEEDGLAMDCMEGNISVDYMKYNLTDSNPGSLTLGQFEGAYKNLTAIPKVNVFNLDYKKDDFGEDMENSTYWRIYVPSDVAGSCSGSIVFGAVKEVAT